MLKPHIRTKRVGGVTMAKIFLELLATVSFSFYRIKILYILALLTERFKF